jgi:hypothetical protein
MRAPVLAWLGFALLLVRVLAIGRVGPGRERARWVIWVSFIVSFLALDFLFAFSLPLPLPVDLQGWVFFALVGAVAIGNQVGNPTFFLVKATHSSLFGFASRSWVFGGIVPFLALTAVKAHVFALAFGA